MRRKRGRRPKRMKLKGKKRTRVGMKLKGKKRTRVAKRRLKKSGGKRVRQ